MTHYIFKDSMIMTGHLFNNHVTGLTNRHFPNLFSEYENYFINSNFLLNFELLFHTHSNKFGKCLVSQIFKHEREAPDIIICCRINSVNKRYHLFAWSDIQEQTHIEIILTFFATRNIRWHILNHNHRIRKYRKSSLLFCISTIHH